MKFEHSNCIDYSCILLHHVCRSVCFVGIVATVLRTAPTKQRSPQIRSCVIIVEKWVTPWLNAHNLLKMVLFAIYLNLIIDMLLCISSFCRYAHSGYKLKYCTSS